MPCVEYHLLLELIILVKSCISLDLEKTWVAQQVFGTIARD